MVLAAGGVLRPQEIGVAASLGLAQLLVRRKPRVAILSTGDEVAEPGSVRKPGQIYDSNRYTLHGMLTRLGCDVLDMGVVRVLGKGDKEGDLLAIIMIESAEGLKNVIPLSTMRGREFMRDYA